MQTTLPKTRTAVGTKLYLQHPNSNITACQGAEATNKSY